MTVDRRHDGRRSARGLPRATSAISPTTASAGAARSSSSTSCSAASMARGADVPRPHRALSRRDCPPPGASPATARVARRDTAAQGRASSTFARDADDPAVRVRMARLGANGWAGSRATRSARWSSRWSPIGWRAALGVADVELACSLDRERCLDGALRRAARDSLAGKAAGAAVLACHGSRQGRARAARARERRRRCGVAQVYLRHRPIADADEIRVVTAGIARMSGRAEAQVRALDTLARHG